MVRRRSNRGRSAFERFVRAYGIARLAKGVGIDPTAICHWMRGATAPRPAHAAIIQRLARKSRSKLTLDQIYQHSRKLRVRERAAAPANFAGTAAPQGQSRAHVREVTAAI
jgi:hypothetical protein